MSLKIVAGQSNIEEIDYLKESQIIYKLESEGRINTVCIVVALREI